MSVLRPGVVHFKLIIDSRPGSSIGLFGSSVYLRTRTSTEGLQWTLVIVNSVLSPICLLMRGVHYSACSLCYKKIAQFHQECSLMRDCSLFRRLPEYTVL